MLGERRGEIEAVMLERRTQTNEPARCALMLPLLAALPQPLALLEVGASAGLCLLPDRYGYDYDGHRARRTAAGAALHARGRRRRCPPRCPRSSGAPGWTSTRSTSPTPTQVRWLELLIWPGQEHRLETLRGAIEVARARPAARARGRPDHATSTRSPPRPRATRRS